MRSFSLNILDNCRRVNIGCAFLPFKLDDRKMFSYKAGEVYNYYNSSSAIELIFGVKPWGKVRNNLSSQLCVK